MEKFANNQRITISPNVIYRHYINNDIIVGIVYLQWQFIVHWYFNVKYTANAILSFMMNTLIAYVHLA